MTQPSPQGELPALQDIEAHLARMREEGELDDVGEGVMRRHFAERAQTLADDFKELLAEHDRRAEADGADAAREWLAEAAEAMGRRDREETQRVLSTVTNTAD